MANNTYIDPSSIPDFSSLLQNYSNPSNLPTSGGPKPAQGKDNTLGNLASGDPLGSFLGIDPVGGLLSSLFGGGSAPSFNPYVDKNGNYVFAPPKSRNPVPVASVPGAPLTPNQNYKQTAGNVQAITDLMPYISNAVNSTLTPSAVAQFNASATTSPAYAQLMTQLYNQFGPALNQIGNQIQHDNAMSQNATANQIMQTGPLGNLMNSIDLTGKLSGSETDAIGQGLARQNALNGTLNAPSQSNTVANAMQYGNANYARKQTAISNLGSALNVATNFMGRNPGQTNMGNSQFTGVNSGGNGSSQFGLAGQMFGGLNSLTAQTNAENFQNSFNSFGNTLSRSAANSIGQIPSQLAGAAGGALI